jgi:GTP pyrophosphokinase
VTGSIPSLGYLFTHRSRLKVRQWFASLALEDTLAEGRAVVVRELQRMGQPGINLDDLAARWALPVARTSSLPLRGPS